MEREGLFSKSVSIQSIFLITAYRSGQVTVFATCGLYTNYKITAFLFISKKRTNPDFPGWRASLSSRNRVYLNAFLTGLPNQACGCLRLKM